MFPLEKILSVTKPLEWCLANGKKPEDFTLIGVHALNNLHDSNILKNFQDNVPPEAEIVLGYKSDEKTLIHYLFLGRYRTIKMASGVAIVPKNKLCLNPSERVLCGLSLSEYCGFVGRNPEDYLISPIHARTENPTENIFELFAGQIPKTVEVVLTPGLPSVCNRNSSQFFASFRVIKYQGGDALIPKILD